MNVLELIDSARAEVADKSSKADAVSRIARVRETENMTSPL